MMELLIEPAPKWIAHRASFKFTELAHRASTKLLELTYRASSELKELVEK